MICAFWLFIHTTVILNQFTILLHQTRPYLTWPDLIYIFAIDVYSFSRCKGVFLNRCWLFLFKCKCQVKLFNVFAIIKQFSNIGFGNIEEMNDIHADVDSFVFVFASFAAYKPQTISNIHVEGQVNVCKNVKMLKALLGSAFKCK